MTSSTAEIDNPLVVARLKADLFPRIGKIGRDAAVRELTDILFKAYIYKGYRYDEENARFIADALFTEILQDMHKLGMKNLSMYEISYCIKKAVLEDMNFFFSVSYLYNILSAYCKGEGHRAHIEAVKINNQLKSREIPALTAKIETYAGALIKKR